MILSRGHIRELAVTLARTLALTWRSSPRLALGNALVAAIQGVLPLAAMVALKHAIDAAAAVARAHPPIHGNSLAWLWHSVECREVAVWFVAGAAAMGAAASLRVLASWLAELHAMAVSDHVHALLHRKLMEVDVAFFESTSEQDRLHLAQEQAMTQPVAVLGSLFQLLQGLLGFLAVLALLAALHPVVALLLAAAGLPTLGLRLRRSRKLYAWRRDLAPLERQAGYFHHLLTSGDYAKEIRLHGFGGFCRQRFEAARLRLRQARLDWRRAVLSQELACQFLALGVVAGLLLWMTGRMLAGALTLGALVMYAQAMQRGQGMLGMTVGAVVDLYQGSLFLRAFNDLMSLPVRVQPRSAPVPVPVSIRRGIVFEHVGFTYPGTERAVLRDLSFSIGPCEHVALVGVNGAGKTTVAKLLCRLYDPSVGRILVDGVDLRDLDPVAWRRRVGVLFQDFGRYQLTAAENIWIGDPRGEPRDERIRLAAVQAGLAEAAAQWPQGLDTPLGRWLNDGVEPSMGQWQRLALARALVRETDLLMLDEPTSALDAITQRASVDLLRQAARGRMALVISHRQEMLQWVQRVIVLRDGAVMEQGAPDALIGQGGEFALLFGS